MWWAGSSSVDIYLGASQGGMVLNERPHLWSDHGDLAAAASRWFKEAVALRRSRLRAPRVRVWVSGALARPFVWGPVQGLRRWSEVTLAARAAAAEATALNAPCVVSLDQWPAMKPLLAVAMEQSTIDAITAASSAAGVRPISVRPWWAHALERSAQDATACSALAIADSDALTVLAAPQGRWTFAHGFFPRPSDAETRPLLDRVMLSAGIEANDVRVVEMQGDLSSQLWQGTTAVGNA